MKVLKGITLVATAVAAITAITKFFGRKKA